MGQAESVPAGSRQEVPVIQIQHDLNDENLSSFIPPSGAEHTPAAAGASTGDAGPSTPAAVIPETEASPEKASDSGSQEGLLRELCEYRLTKRTLGEGAFAKVRLATSESTGHQVAVKIIKRKKLDERAEVLLNREVKHHEKLRHANIVRLHTWIQGPSKYYLVMEYCAGGDLLQYVNKAGLLSDALARRLFNGLMDGISFCHRLGIYHRDLKLENLMLSSTDEPTMKIKIADFGLSDLRTKPGDHSDTLCGSPLYAAPELMTDGAALDGYDAGKSDVWSCGVILYALLVSALPFDADDIHSLVRLIQNGMPNSPVPADRGPEAAELVSLMLAVDAKSRLTAPEVLAHAWLKPKGGGIKGSQTTMSLPSAPAAAKRRGASETTQFYKQVLELDTCGSRDPHAAYAHVTMGAGAPRLGDLIPTGESSPLATPFAVGGNASAPRYMDDEFAVTTPTTAFEAAGCGRYFKQRLHDVGGNGDAITLFADRQHRVYQIFTGAHEGWGWDTIALEPMSALADAFNNGDGLRVLRPGETFEGEFGLQLE